MRKLVATVAVLAATLGVVSAATGAEVVTPREPNVLVVVPFAALLLAIAVMPFLNQRFWEHNYPKIAVGLGLVTVLYYVLVLHNPARVVTSLVEYVGFMALIGSLFVIAGGIHINMSGRSTPLLNTILLAIGALLANLIGTTGASMLLIRPFLRINKYRAAPFHAVYFIFIVSNIGGALTPIGDPPLFLGYLKGVPFFWLLESPQILLAWLFCVGVLLALFFLIDSRHFQKHKPDLMPLADNRVQLEGTHNFVWLFVILALVLVQKAEWLHALGSSLAVASLGQPLGWDSSRTAENLITVATAALMIATAWLSHRFANQHALRENEFTFGPVREVGFLFVGIFATMVPALELLEKHAADIGITTVRQFFWGSGALSGVLDNAPTYLNFLTAAFGLHHLSLENPAHMQSFLLDPQTAQYIIAISLGSVFFGANTYIGNGPNFMVKSIAESSGLRCPSFFGYVLKYTLPILLPLFALVSWLILR